MASSMVEQTSTELPTFYQLVDRLSSHLKQNGKPESFIYVNLLALTEVQVRRAFQAEGEHLDLLAWATRNLFELLLLCRFLLESPNHLVEFVGQKARDEIEIIEGFLVLSEFFSIPEAAKRLNATTAHITQSISKIGVTPARGISTKSLASRFGLEREYSVLFKLCSKYVHPSALMVSSPHWIRKQESFRSILLSGAEAYAMNILNLVALYAEYKLPSRIADSIPNFLVKG